MSYTLLHAHTSGGSLLDGYSKPKDLVKRAKELGMKACAVTDHGTCFSHVAMYEEAKKAGIKPILGVELYIAYEPVALKLGRDQTHGVTWAKNEKGLKQLWKMVSYSNEPDIFYYKPRLNLHNWIHPETKKEYYGIEHFCQDGNIAGMSGHHGSLLCDEIFADCFGDPVKRKENIKRAYASYKTNDREFYDKLRKDNWLESTCEMALRLEKVYGKGNFWIELQNELEPTDRMPLWLHPTIVDSLREVSKQTGIPCTCSSDPHYVYKEDAEDQRAMLKITLKETDESIETKLSDSDKLDILPFFSSNNFFVHDIDYMKERFTNEEIAESNKIADQVEDYNIIKTPKIPQFDAPIFNENESFLADCPTRSDKFLMHLVIDGAKRKRPWEKSGIAKENYWNRIQEETQVIFKGGLSDYLLLIWDILCFCRNCPVDGSYDWMSNLKNNGKINPIIIGSGRGSVGGCLTAYMMDIHQADSLRYGLLFSRFFNPARANDLMDIDTDIEMKRRDEVVNYLKWKYGERNVGQIITFGKSMGKASIKDIFRIKGIENGYEIANEICKYIPDEAKIADEIQEVRNSGEDYGVIDWALEHIEELQEYYKKYKDIFDQASRIEGTPRNAGRHASGYLVNPGQDIDEMFPMAWDAKSKRKVIAFDMNTVSKLGGVKLDLLGLTLLDRMKLTQDLVNRNVK